MHQVDKVAASGIGDLVRRRKKQVMTHSGVAWAGLSV
jgi:hypothetical protein